MLGVSVSETLAHPDEIFTRCVAWRENELESF